MIDKFTETLSILLQGNIPEEIDLGRIDDEGERKLANILNKLIEFMREVHDFIIPLSNGELADIKVSPKNFFGSPFKELHSRLLHLTWQAKQVATGDFSQRVDFMGDFSEAFNSMIVSLDEHEKMLKNKITELEQAILRIKKLEGILPICSHCKKIRLEGADYKKQEGWVKIECYLSEKTDARFSHSVCPECMKKLYPEIT
ncbi:MAG: hypothetical protein JW781_08950 [Deltaproteobacteria bacterium]|nr:hypothetical protein [Candidatus Anaeroferrophillacea bacterium]